MTGFVEVCTCPAYTAQKILCARLGSDRFRFWLREVISDDAVQRRSVSMSASGHKSCFYELPHGFRQLLES